MKHNRDGNFRVKCRNCRFMSPKIRGDKGRAVQSTRTNTPSFRREHNAGNTNRHSNRDESEKTYAL